MWIITFLLVLWIMILYLASVSYGVCRPLFYPRITKKKRNAVLPQGTSVSCTTSDGSKLRIWVLPAASRQRQAVILVPDGGEPGMALGRQAEWFLHKGYHVILVDQRGCDRKKRRPVTLGYREHRDLRLVFTQARRILGEDCRIGTYGVGMGAVTVLLHACLDERVDFVIADSPWSDLRRWLRMILEQDKQMPPYPVMWVLGWMSRLWVGVSVKEVSPIAALRRRQGLVAVPVLFIVGESDRKKEMVQELYDVKQGDKVLYLTPDPVDPVQYGLQVEAFLREIAEEKRAVV